MHQNCAAKVLEECENELKIAMWQNVKHIQHVFGKKYVAEGVDHFQCMHKGGN